jgi:hypothetical protein
MIAAPTVTGCWDTKELSFSLANTPGDIKVSAMFYRVLLIIHMTESFKNYTF